MKKITPILAIAAIAAFTSCKKTYTCSCAYDFLGEQLTYSYTTPKMKKSDAKSQCEAYTNTAWTDVKCTLK